MRALLDTHAFLWAAVGSERLSSTALEVLEGSDHELLFSAASAYEIGVKAARGRLDLPDSPDAFVASRIALFGLREVPVTIAHSLAAAALPAHHRDPWDRLLVAQALTERVAILTNDARIRQYDVETVW